VDDIHTHPAVPRTLRLDGTGGSFLKTGFDPQEMALRAGAAPADPGFGEETRAEWGTLTAPDGRARAVRSRTGRWLTFYERMRDAIAAGAPVPVSAREAGRVIALIEAGFASSRAGRRITLR